MQRKEFPFLSISQFNMLEPEAGIRRNKREKTGSGKGGGGGQVK